MATWQVTADTPGQYDWDGAGNPITGHTISFKTGNGSRGSVFVPDDHYNADAVKTLISAQAATADQIASLTSES